MLETLSSWLTAPSANAVDQLFKKVDSLLNELKEKAQGLEAAQAESLKVVETKLNELKQKIPFKNGNVDSEAWQAKDSKERKEIGRTLYGLFKKLMAVNQDELRVGRSYFLIFFGLLLAVTVLYAGLHRSRNPKSADPALIADVARLLRNVELEIKAVAQAKAKGQPQNLAELQKQVGALRERLKGVDLGFPALQLLGTVESEAERGEVTETDSFARLSRTLLADLESLHVAFLWNDRRGRWWEIAWWAEIGVLVGILFYIAGSLSQGRFAREEIAMLWAETVMAPIVVLVIFFLFTLTGLTGIAPTETSITGNAGFAFIFGFAIRRTLGLLDTIKKRIFPEPQPA